MNYWKLFFSAVILSMFSLMSCNTGSEGTSQMSVKDSLSEKQQMIKKITDLEHKMYNDSTHEINMRYADPMLLLYARYSNTFPDDTMSPKYLMQAARLAMSLQRGKAAVLYFDKILKHYKSSSQASMALFLKAFSYEQIVGDTAKAKKYYTEFIHDYPNDKLVEDAKASIQYLGVPDSILLKRFEEKEQ